MLITVAFLISTVAPAASHHRVAAASHHRVAVEASTAAWRAVDN
jgi:hypothetical protein